MPALQQADAPNGGLGPEIFFIRDPATDQLVQVTKTRFYLNQLMNETFIMGVSVGRIGMGLAGILLAALAVHYARKQLGGGKATARRRRKRKG